MHIVHTYAVDVQNPEAVDGKYSLKKQMGLWFSSSPLLIQSRTQSEY